MPLSEKAQENKKKYDLNYKKNNFKRVPLDLRIDEYNNLKAYCDKKGVGVNPFIKSAINEKMDRDK